MPNRAIYLLVVEGFADWEPAHAVAELRRHGGYRVETVGLDRNPVISMGGLRITPSRTIDELNINDVAAFILPGGDRWENMPVEAELESALKQLDARKVPIAAICAATVAISRVGLLRGRQHTSNGLSYLQSHVPITMRRRIMLRPQRYGIAVLSQPADSETLSLRANSSRS